MDNPTHEALKLSEQESEVCSASFVWNGVVHKHEWVVTPAGLLVWEQVTRTPLPLVRASGEASKEHGHA